MLFDIIAINILNFCVLFFLIEAVRLTRKRKIPNTYRCDTKII